MNCPYCGNAVAEGAAFCGNCGAKLDGSAAQASPQEAAVPPQEPTPPPVKEPVAPPPPPFVEPVAVPPPGPTPTYAPSAPPAKKSNKTLIIIVIVLLLLLCCCCAILIGFAQLGPVITDILSQAEQGLK